MQPFKGIYTALITPFVDDRLDEEGLRQNIRKQIEANVDGIVLLSTTGEAPTLNKQEQKRVVQIGVEEAKNALTVIVGAGTYSTQETIANAEMAEELGADMLQMITPYYNRPNQEGIYRHFEQVCKHSALPILLYNHPGRTGVNIEPSTLCRLAELPSIIAVKECNSNFTHINEAIQETKKINPSFAILSGDDSFALPMIALGATGLISVLSNLIPEEIKALVDALLSFRFEETFELHTQLQPYFKLLSLDVNPLPIKAAMKALGYAAGAPRLPLCEMAHDKLPELLSLCSSL